MDGGMAGMLGGAVGTKGLEPFASLAAQGAMIERLSSDSRRCAPGVAFFAYPGERADGRGYISEAIERGAAAVLWDDSGFSWREQWRVPNVAVPGLRQQAGLLAHEFYGRASESLWTCGVTGTNGKTSCSQWIAALLSRRGARSAVIGTLGSGYPGALSEASNTTPDTLELHRMLKDFIADGASAVAMEVSSHGLAQGRVNGVRFACALFTNLSHDHLDYHGSMRAYAQAKALLFDTPGLGAAVLNLDDAFGVQLAQRLARRGVRTIGYSLSRAGVVAGSVSEFVAISAVAGERVELDSSWGAASAVVKPLGRFNLANALGVLGVLISYGVAFREAAALLAELPPVRGRMQAVAQQPLVVVDYAHTPDALEKVLSALRPVAQARGGELAVVFGAGGDRDPAKRPLMGEVAARLADRVVLTSDNPRSEDPLAIIEAIRRGMSRPCEREPDRAKAITQALRAAAPQDVVLVAGKGHEDYQEIAGRRTPFSDEAAVRSALAQPGRP